MLPNSMHLTAGYEPVCPVVWRGGVARLPLSRLGDNGSHNMDDRTLTEMPIEQLWTLHQRVTSILASRIGSLRPLRVSPSGRHSGRIYQHTRLTGAAACVRMHLTIRPAEFADTQ